MGGIGLDRDELERCVFTSQPPPYQEKGFIFHQGVYKKDRRIKSIDGGSAETAMEIKK